MPAEKSAGHGPVVDANLKSGYNDRKPHHGRDLTHKEREKSPASRKQEPQMTRQEIFDYAKIRYGTEPDYPWSDSNAVLRHGDNNRWYGLVMEVGRGKLGIPGEGRVDIINVKCDPMLGSALRLRDGFHPAYHMNKEKWLTVRLDGSVPEDEIKNQIGLSFELTSAKKKQRRIWQ